MLFQNYFVVIFPIRNEPTLSISYDRDAYKTAAFVKNMEDNTNCLSRATSTFVTCGQQSKG
jgi:hypothetical protein